MKTNRFKLILSVFSVMFVVTACLPDLVIRRFKIIPPAATTVDQIGCYVKVKNNSYFRTAGQSRLELRIDRSGSVAYMRQRDVPSIRPRGTRNLVVYTFLNNPGNYSANVTADVLNMVNESREGNNNRTINFGVIGIPRFIDADYIQLDRIYRISKFRSGIGHDSSDDFESCRSMKHYFQPQDSVNWSTVQIFSPINGTVIGVHNEWAGTKVQIRSNQYPEFFISIYHINLSNTLNINDIVNAGQLLGTHIGTQTYSDIEVSFNTPGGLKRLSYFHVMTDSLFERYQARGLNSRNDAIILMGKRNTHPLTCGSGGEFADSGDLENWVVLN